MPREPVLELSFSAGIDQSQRREIMKPGTGWVLIENARQAARGGISKRWGFGAWGLGRQDATSRSAGRKLIAKGKQVLTIDGSRLDSYDHTLTTWFYDSAGQPMTAPGYSLMPTPVSAFDGVTEVIDVAEVNGMVVIAYRVSTVPGTTYVGAAVMSRLTGAVLRAPELLSPASTGGEYIIPALAVASGVVFVVWIQEGHANVIERHIDLSTAGGINTGWTNAANLKTDREIGAADLGAFAIENMSNGTHFSVAYTNNSGGASPLTVFTVSAAGAVSATGTVNTASVVPSAVALAAGTSGANSVLWVAWNQTTTVRACGLSQSNVGAAAVYTTATLITATAAPVSLGGPGRTGAIALVTSDGNVSGDGRLFVNDGNSTHLRIATFTNAAGAVSLSGSVVDVPCAFLCGRPFRSGTRYYGMCFGGTSTNPQSVAILCDLTATTTYLRPVANLQPSLAHPAGILCRALHSSGAIVTALEVQTTGGIHGAWLATFEFTPSGINATGAHRWATAEHGGMTFLSGGVLSVIDGGRVTEASFLLRPTQPTTSTAGSGLTGDFRYIVTYEYRNADGLWDISGVSEPSEVVSPADDTVTVTAIPLSISARLTATIDPVVRVSLWRTLDGGEPPYYYVASTANNTTAATLTYADAASDATISTHAQLYRVRADVDGALDHDATPGLMHLTTCNGSLVGAIGEDLYASGFAASGEAPWFSQGLVEPLPGGGGPVTGLKSQDGAVYAFKADRIYALAVEPFSADGLGGFSTPRLLATDVGCVNARSLVATSMGIFFQSAKGIEILTRAQAVEYIGEPVRDTLAAYPVITSAVLDAENALVYFECADSEPAINAGAAGVALVYDLRARIWQSIDRRRSYANGANHPSISSSMVWTGTEYRYAWLEAGTGRVRVEDDSLNDTTSGGTAFIVKRAKTPCVHLAGVQGEQIVDRVLLLAEYDDEHDITITATHDYDESNTDSQEWTDALLSAMTPIVCDFGLEQSVGQSVEIEVADSQASGGGTEGDSVWVALTFSGEPKSGPKRTTYSHRGGT